MKRSPDVQRVRDLQMERALSGLSREVEAELAGLLGGAAQDPDDLELAAAAIYLAHVGPPREPLPDGMRRRLQQRLDELCADPE